MIKKIPDNFWFPFWVDKWIFGSMRLEFEPEERALWLDLLCLAAKDEGYIRANEETPYLTKQLAGLLVYDEDFFEKTIQKFVQKKKLERDERGILKVATHEKYRISPSYKRVLKHRKIKAEKEDETEGVSNETGHVTHNKTNHNKTNHNKEEYPPEFESLWKKYPLKRGKQEAFDVWKILNKKEKGEVDIAAGNYAEEARRLKTEDQYILHAKTFLRKKKRRWVDYLEPQPQKPQVGESSKKPSPERELYYEVRQKKYEELQRKYKDEFQKARKNEDKKKFEEIVKKIDEEMAEWSKEYTGS